MNEEFENWYETFERDGGELMLYNTIDLEAAYLAGAAAMREKAAEVAKGFIIKQHHAGDNISITQSNIAKDIAAAIRKLEVE